MSFNSHGKLKFRKNFNDFINLFCNSIILIRTELFKKKIRSYLKKINKGKVPRYKPTHKRILEVSLKELFENVSNEELIHRTEIRKKLFNLANDKRIDCDSDFPFSSGKVIEILLEVLSNNKEFGTPIPRYKKMPDSKESKEIQLADLVSGFITWNIKKGNSIPEVFEKLEFEEKILPRWFAGRENLISFYYWESGY